MSENEPPIGEPIYGELKRSEEDESPGEGKNVVITPQTAGSAGAAHEES